MVWELNIDVRFKLQIVANVIFNAKDYIALTLGFTVLHCSAAGNLWHLHFKRRYNTKVVANRGLFMGLSTYCIVAGTNPCFEVHAGLVRLSMKGIFDAYVL